MWAEIIATETSYGQDCHEVDDVDTIDDSFDHGDVTCDLAPGLYNWSLIAQLSFTLVDIYIQ